MVNIHDIQLGNLFLHDGEIFRVDHINALQEGLNPMLTMKDDNEFCGFVLARASELEPLPITTELLEKFFDKPLQACETYNVPNSNFFVQDCLAITGCVIIEMGFTYIKPVEYVHDMQNLVYQLTKIKIELC